MKLESQVCSLEIAKKLKELGVKQESLFYWYKNNKEDSNNFIEYEQLLYENIYRNYPDPVKMCSAFTISELLEFLPILNKTKINITKGYDIENNLTYTCHYDFCETWFNNLYKKDVHLPDVCAKMLIHLIENNLLEI